MLAARHCTDTGCHNYHGIRLLLQSLGLRGLWTTQYQVFHTGLRELMHQGVAALPSSVLICGSADYAVPLLVSDALSDICAECDISVLDRCETPLALCNLAIQDTGAYWRLLQYDILDDDLSGNYDLIASDRFLGFFDAADRTRLFRRWHELLSPGGSILITVPIGSAEQEILATDHWWAFEDRFLQLLEDHEPIPGHTAEALLSMAESYISQRNRHPFDAESAVLSEIERGGFRPLSVRKLARNTDTGTLSGRRDVLTIAATPAG